MKLLEPITYPTPKPGTRDFLPLWKTRKVLTCMPAPKNKFPCDHCFWQANGKKDDTCTKPEDWSGCTEFNRPDGQDVIFVAYEFKKTEPSENIVPYEFEK